MNVTTLRDKFVYHLQEMYYVETELVDVLEQLASDVSNEDLRRGLTEHLEETRGHVTRLEEVFEAVDESPETNRSATFDALLVEREELLQNATDDADMRDLCNLGIAAKNEHMEIAGYENLIMLARKLDLPRDVRNRLDENLDDEQQTKKQLKAIAEDSPAREIFARLAG